MTPRHAIAFLPGAGGDAPDLDVFREGPDDPNRVELIDYPGWRRYVTRGYSADALIDDLAIEIARRIPTGPIRIVGVSIGGHFGYAAGLRLRAQGREIAGLCAIDSMMIESSGPSAGWRRRALELVLEQLRQRRLGDLARFMRSRFWRGLARAFGDRLPRMAERYAASFSAVAALDPIFEQELSMRLLIRTVAPWMASVDRNPVALDAPAILLRTGLAAGDDEAWRRRCPDIKIFEIPGKHHSLFDAGNVGTLHEVFVSATTDWR
ncbi:alpha/beta fold hydrolase [Bradyrhizobium ontarionense]|uniref:Alpha/beta fold hydrolase n=1 Tax=Bradyrhizobium ontarionense TaxID=2898149 RepID=A0ABY3RBY9_9BRAD|nr:alpha/beta fold hydrolase [Bradyrhizobium sp. A19]UFZ04783.1 alpha/beta fold hydrolase [Bradyrhizobium sp. A19]